MSFLTEFYLIIITQGIIIGGFSGFIAKEKNRDQAGWFFLGFLFSLLAVIAIAAVPKLEKSTSELTQEGGVIEDAPREDHTSSGNPLVTFAFSLIMYGLPLFALYWFIFR